MADPIYYIGKGKIYCGLADKTDALRYISNVEEFKLTVNDKQETLKDYDTLAGGNVMTIAQIDKAEVSLTFSDMTPENLAMALFGSNTAVNAGTATNESHKVFKGGLLPLTHVNPSTVTLTNGSTVTYTAGTDYTVEGVGLYIPTTSTIVDGSTVTLASYNYTAYADIEAMTTTGKEYRIVFDGKNMANSNKPLMVELFKVRFGPIKDLGLKTETFAKVAITGECLKNTSITAQGKSQYFKAYMVQ